MGGVAGEHSGTVDADFRGYDEHGTCRQSAETSRGLLQRPSLSGQAVDCLYFVLMQQVCNMPLVMKPCAVYTVWHSLSSTRQEVGSF